MSGNNDLARYYAERSQEYESIYRKPERQKDLAALRAIIPGLLDGHDVPTPWRSES